MSRPRDPRHPHIAAFDDVVRDADDLLYRLADIVGLGKDTDPGWEARIAPFAPVWAAMIQAVALRYAAECENRRHDERRDARS